MNTFSKAVIIVIVGLTLFSMCVYVVDYELSYNDNMKAYHENIMRQKVYDAIMDMPNNTNCTWEREYVYTLPLYRQKRTTGYADGSFVVSYHPKMPDRITRYYERLNCN